MSKGSAPSAPDPWQSAAAQYQYGTEAANYTTALQRPDIVTPYGSETWGQGSPSGAQAPSAYTPPPVYPDGAVNNGRVGSSSYTPSFGFGSNPITASGAPQYTQNISLSPAQQTLLNLQEGNQIGSGVTAQELLPQISHNISNPVANTPVQSGIDTSGVSAIPGANDLSGFTQQAQDAAYKQQTQYLDPQFSQQQEQLDSQLRNQGAYPGTAAYDNAMKLFTNQKQQAYSNAEEQAVGQGLQEQQALYGEGANTNQQQFGQAAAEQQAANAASGQKLSQSLELNQLPLSQYETLTGGSATPAPASFGLGGSGGGAGSVSAPDIMGAFNNQYAGQLANYNANTASTNQDIGTAASLLAMYLMM